MSPPQPQPCHLRLHAQAYQQQDQPTEPGRILLLVNVCGSFGYIDAKGAMLVPARYDAALPFATVWAAIRRGGKWGYIDKSGTETISPRYDKARNFRWNCSPVRMGDRWHFIRPDGSEAFQRASMSPAVFKTIAPACNSKVSGAGWAFVGMS